MKEPIDLFKNLEDPFKEGHENKHIYSVSEITQDIKIIFENTFSQVWVEGEISNFKSANSGHFYFTLKDKTAVLAAAMFARANKELKFKIEDGLKVIREAGLRFDPSKNYSYYQMA